MQTRYDHTSDDGQMRCISLVEPSSSLMLCLVGHAESEDPALFGSIYGVRVA
jgi:hypothetical protein